MATCSPIDSRLNAYECDTLSVGGTAADVYLFDWNDFTASGASPVVNEEGVITAFGLTSKMAVVFETADDSTSASCSLTRGAYYHRYTHAVDLRVFVNTQEAREWIETLAHSRVFAAVVNRTAGDDGMQKVSVYGMHRGMKLVSSAFSTTFADQVVYSLRLEGEDEDGLPRVATELACDNATHISPTKVEITIDRGSFTAAGQTAQCTAVVYPTQCSQVVTWSCSSNASITADGLLTLDEWTSAASVVVTATTEDGSVSGVASVSLLHAERIVVTSDVSEFTAAGQTAQCTAVVYPTEAAQDVTWRVTIGDATITEAGVLTLTTFTSGGSVVVRATSKLDESVYGAVTIAEQVQGLIVTFDEETGTLTYDAIGGIYQLYSKGKESYSDIQARGYDEELIKRIVVTSNVRIIDGDWMFGYGSAGLENLEEATFGDGVFDETTSLREFLFSGITREIVVNMGKSSFASVVNGLSSFLSFADYYCETATFEKLEDMERFCMGDVISFPAATFEAATNAHSAFYVGTEIYLPSATFASLTNGTHMFDSEYTHIYLPKATFAELTDASVMFQSVTPILFDLRSATFAKATWEYEIIAPPFYNAVFGGEVYLMANENSEIFNEMSTCRVNSDNPPTLYISAWQDGTVLTAETRAAFEAKGWTISIVEE